MTGTYREYKYEVEYKQNSVGAWFAEIVHITRPDGSRLEPYQPRTAHRELQVVKLEANAFIRSEIDQDLGLASAAQI